MNLPIFAPLLHKDFWSRGSLRNPDYFQSSGTRSSGTRSSGAGPSVSHIDRREHQTRRGPEQSIHIDTTYEVRIQLGGHDRETFDGAYGHSDVEYDCT